MLHRRFAYSYILAELHFHVVPVYTTQWCKLLRTQEKVCGAKVKPLEKMQVGLKRDIKGYV